MIFHCEHALNSNEVGSEVLRSPSGDTDINIVAASLITNDASRVFVDCSTGDNRKVLCLGDLVLNNVEKSALIGTLFILSQAMITHPHSSDGQREYNFSEPDKTCHGWEPDKLLIFGDKDDETEQIYVEAGEESDESDLDES